MLRFLVRLRRWENWAKAAGIITIFVSVIVCSFLWAISNPPSPSRGPIAHSDQHQPQSGKQGSDSDQVGTKGVPLFVQIAPAANGTAEAERDERERQQKAANERGLTVATWLMAFATFFLVVVAAGQAGLFVWQLGYMRDGMKDAAIAARAARDGAGAATESARIARSVERPYIAPIKAELSYPGGDFIPEEGMPLTLEMDLQNFGKGLAFLLGYGIAHEVCQAGQEGGKPLIEPERFHGIRLSPGSIFKTKASYGLIRVPIKEYESFLNGSNCFFLYGYLRYLDLFGVIRRTSFSYEYITPPDDKKPLLVLNVRPGLWYDFEEDRPAQTKG
jgi:hypothetical protein